jgi:putative tryptophan/tyrosine transport system substrate-binding protein
VLLNPANLASGTTLQDVVPAARAIGLQIQVVRASTGREINAAFASLLRDRPRALFVGGDAFFVSRRVQIATLAARHAFPAIYSTREFTRSRRPDELRKQHFSGVAQVGVYAGCILKVAKPADLPVVQASKLELVINAETARILDLSVPPTLLSLADEVIE